MNIIKNISNKINLAKINIEKFKTPFHFKENYNSVVPLKIYQTWYTKKLPIKMFNNVNLMKINHPRFEYHLYDDNDCREFIKNNFDEKVLGAFDKLIPGAYKADLWRYCILYKNGGIYVDIKFKCINNFRLIALTEKEHFVHDLNENGIYNALMSSKPGNPILLKCINQIVENVKNKYYGESMLQPTGPLLMDKFFDKELKNNIELRLETLDISNTHQHIIKYNDKYIMVIYEGYREDQKLYQNNEHYSVLWRKKNIYKNI
jgi:mannosyltransferase OCH1-like enzyme